MINFWKDNDKKYLNSKQIWWKALKFYLFAQLFVFCLLVIGFVFAKFFDVDMEMFEEREMKDNFYNSRISIVLIAPLIEEIAFRLNLSFKKIHILISLPVLSIIFLSVLLKDLEYILLLKIIIPACLFILLWFISQEFLDQCRHEFGKQAVIIILLLFAFAHINNFNIHYNYLPVYFLLCLPQLVMGITFSYLRLNISFTAAVLMHICVNGFSVLIN